MKIKDFICKVNIGKNGFHAHMRVSKKKCVAGYQLASFVEIVRVDRDGDEQPFMFLCTDVIDVDSWNMLKMILLL